ncbi:MAG: AsnC family transcriptional regulator [Candidatus Bathyarchaeota archaeon]|nr:AsnC family transcriptional regulator [Candidatus Bathyarchaeum sp.]
MDEIDLQILRELSKDARTPFSKIAKKIGVANQTVINRYNEMKKQGTIQFCSITINLEKIGYQGSVHLLINSSSEHNLSKTMDHLKKTENILIATKTIGDFEGYAALAFENVKEIYDTVLQLKSLQEVGHVELSFALPGIKNFPRNRHLIQ